MFLTRELVQDADLGDSVVYGGSRLAIAACLAGAGFFLWLACWVTVQTGANEDPFFLGFDALGVAFGLGGAAWIWRMRLTIGVQGFRYERTFRSWQFSWRDILDVQDESVGSRTRQVVVRLRSDTFHDRQFRLSSFPGFSGSAMEIAQSMRERLEVSPEAPAPGGLDRTRSLVSGNLVIDPELGECSVISGSRGWPVLAGLGVLCLAYLAWAYLGSSGERPTLGQTAMIGGASTLFCVIAVATRRMKLLIGQRGFRYTRPLRRVQANWEAVGTARVEGEGRSLRLVVPVRDERGRWHDFNPLNDFAIDLGGVRDLLNAAREARVGEGPSGEPGPRSGRRSWRPRWWPWSDGSSSRPNDSLE